MPVLNALQDMHAEMKEWRHAIHRHPETAFEEHQTAQMVADLLEQFGVDEIQRGFGQTGVVGIIKGKEAGPGKIGLRADMDALHLQELNEFDHRSQQDGKMHACGHDGHTCMLLGAAKHLAATRNFKGTVYCFFQPAEENEGGANEMIKDGLFEACPVDAVYGMHNWPAVEAGIFCVKPGALMAANGRFEIVVTGRGGHAAMPDQTVDTIVVSAHLVQALQLIASRQTSPLDSVVVTITQMHAGDAWNVIPETCTLRGTVRTLSEDVRQKTFASIERICAEIPAAFGAHADCQIQSGYPVTFNDPQATKAALRAAEKVVGDDCIRTEFESTMGSEDFSFMLQEKPGAYVFLGNSGDHTMPNGAPCMLHNPHYDFNDELLPIGASYFVTLVEQELS